MKKKRVFQAGAITFQIQDDKIKILLIRSKKDPSRWIFPKGHIERSETEQQASLRELLEEAGVEGEIITRAGELDFKQNEKHCNVAYYLCRFLRKSGNGENGREPSWFDFDEAVERLYFPNSRQLLLSSLEKITK